MKIERLFNADAVSGYRLDRRQFFDFRQSTLPNGMRIIDAYAAGLHITLLPDRGMDVWTAHYNGIPLTWIAPGSPFPPDYGASWLRQFNGGLLTTCGLTHVGPPEFDPVTGEQRGIHGNFTRQRATDIRVTSDPGTPNTLTLRATIHQSALFGEQLRVERAYTLNCTQPTLQLRDTITNLGDQPTPFMLLYHINLGYPLVREGTTLYTPPHTVYPRDAAARAGLATWESYDAPTPGYAEQVFFHDLRAFEIAVGQPDLLMTVEWWPMPYLSQWKNTRQGQYVNGIEPGNCIPEGQNAAREAGRLQLLDPGEQYTTSLRIELVDDPDMIQQQVTRIQTSSDQDTSNFQLADYTP